MATPDTRPLLELRGIGRSFRTGDSVLKVLDGVSLDIRAGEFVAIMGQSGSGKSTLMNIIGCLDRPSEGRYAIHGQDVAALDPDALAALRRQTFGFIFQRYNLLANATAAENVEVPAIYAGEGTAARRGRVAQLLERLGLGNRQDHRPGQLSGGQQQRVAIARALMNNPPVILADEPTGALDSKSGQEVMQLLKDLNAEGRTIILITHDAGVAAHAHRQVRIADGRIVDDSGAGKHQPRAEADAAAALEGAAGTDRHGGGVPGTAEAVKIALRALRVSLFRTSLTLLGIVIGVAAVVTLMAVGSGSRDQVLSQISAMGTNLLSIRPGAPELRSSGDVATLTQADAAAIRELGNVSSAVAQRDGRFTVRHGNTDYATTISGVEPDLPNLRDWPVGTGSFFTDRDVQGYAPVIVLGQTVVDALFPDGDDPIGAYVLVGNIPFEVIGTMEAKGAGGGGQDQDDTAFVPLTTGLVRLFGQSYVSGISVKVADVNRIDDTQEAMRQLLISRHRTEDFRIRNMASILEAANTTLTTLTLLLATIAAISLLVGGIGVMNIMLVSVTERTREIGIRMATGARRWDILLQFTTEAAVVGTLGGVIGVALGLLIAVVLKLFGVPVAFSIGPSLMAFGSAFATGLVFGWWPARRASRLDPVVALSTD